MPSIKSAVLFSAAVAFGVQATTIHVNRGCIDLDGKPLCSGDTDTITSGAATFYAMFDGSNSGPSSVPGCVLDATWPAYYGDIFFGADNCLYDAHANPINGECCTAGTGGTSPVANPYYRGSHPYYPPDQYYPAPTPYYYY